MPTNPRVVKAFRAMKALGISEKQVKPVLKKMLKLYEKNWELIEEENYRALADAIFDEEESKVPDENDDATEGTFEEKTRISNEPERPFKRLRRGQDGQGSSPPNNSDLVLAGSSSRKPKVEGKVLPGAKSQKQSLETRNSQPRPISLRNPAGNMSSQTVSPGCLAVPEHSSQSDLSDMDGTLLSDSLLSWKQRPYKGKEPLLPEAAPQEKRPNLKGSSQAVHFKDPVVQPSAFLSPKQKVPHSRALIKPKDEPFTGDMPFEDARQRIAIIRPDSASKEQSLIQRVSSRKQHHQEPPASQFLAGDDMEDNVPVSSIPARDSCELATIPEDSPASLEIATSALGEERILNVTPALDLLKKSVGVGGIKENNHVPAYVARGSVDARHFDEVAAFQIPRPLQPLNVLEVVQVSEEAIENGCSGSGKVNEFRDAEFGSLIVVPQSQLTPDEFRSLHYRTDITKGEEMVEIPWLNDVNSEFPPFFNYIPRNLIFQNAYVNFTLSQTRAENCCLACIGNCLLSSTPCVCSSDTEHGFAYTLEGLVKEDFLEDCISLTRDPQRQCLSYCRDCPLERSKNDEILEPCKGHVKRKYIEECWSKCGCHKQCGNRVVQRGIRCKLQVFFTPEGKRWGLRTLEMLPKGTFVCEYVGEILTNKEFYERKMQRTSSSKTEKHAYPVLLDADWCLKGVVKDEEALCLDATFYGNIARFINHRCLDANMIEIPVKIETPDHHYYHLAFFTTREVNALEELTWDYGIDFDDTDQPVEVFPCRCGSKFCRNMKRSNRSNSAAR
ncbi:probable inactive histone-lysine N-methyltransferase SUVR2 isoform X2 [Populus alba]|uniref:Histone-lysine N-methyltransferase SUVR2-like isoform X3 n=1 Tax=Populus alba TaxID=43335 RepID=A0A4U5QYL0_POPAL|nr:probable inactive histone-lysine N-methyltransferase SUVR2 isoform X2 [Populus alba]XP_034891463.1 probable inactive histone-lysine N-methyltransferase SUVR2 isoform X2 [Populus alba]TKS16324.1 histone-lysine N-methyltransferase SUVR2-like isoform X3 [Populus alba]